MSARRTQRLELNPCIPNHPTRQPFNKIKVYGVRLCSLEFVGCGLVGLIGGCLELLGVLINLIIFFLGDSTYEHRSVEMYCRMYYSNISSIDILRSIYYVR